MKMQNYILDHRFLQFVNILCVQLHISDRLRAFLYALIASNNSQLIHSGTQTHIRLSDLQQSLTDFSTDAEKKHVTQAQLLKLFYLLQNVQEKLNISLIGFKLELDETGNNDTVYITLDILDRYTEVIDYIDLKLDGEFSIDTLVIAVSELFPNSLENAVERRYQPTYAKTKKKMEKFPSLFSELVKLGKIEGINVDEMQRELKEIVAKINVDVTLICEQLEKWDTEQREILKKEQQGQKQNTQHTQQINLHDINNEFSDISNNYSQQPVKEYADELKQQYQNRPASHWYNLANNRIGIKNNNTRNNKELNRNNIKNNNVNNIDHSNSIKTNNSLANSHHVSHYT